MVHDVGCQRLRSVHTSTDRNRVLNGNSKLVLRSRVSSVDIYYLLSDELEAKETTATLQILPLQGNGKVGLYKFGMTRSTRSAETSFDKLRSPGIRRGGGTTCRPRQGKHFSREAAPCDRVMKRSGAREADRVLPIEELRLMLLSLHSRSFVEKVDVNLLAKDHRPSSVWRSLSLRDGGVLEEKTSRGPRNRKEFLECQAILLRPIRRDGKCQNLSISSMTGRVADTWLLVLDACLRRRSRVRDSQCVLHRTSFLPPDALLGQLLLVSRSLLKKAD